MKDLNVPPFQCPECEAFKIHVRFFFFYPGEGEDWAKWKCEECGHRWDEEL